MQSSLKMKDTDTAPPSGNTGTFRLFDLPVELQLRIFEYAVIQERPIAITYHVFVAQQYPSYLAEVSDGASRFCRIMWKDPATKDDCIQPAITRTCRAIRADALKFYYRNNDFQAGLCTNAKELEATQTWLSGIGEANRKHVRKLVISDPIGDYQDSGIPGDLRSAEGDECLEGAKRVFAEHWAAGLEHVPGGDHSEHKVVFRTSSETDEAE